MMEHASKLMSPEAFQEQLERQGNACAICRTTDPKRKGSKSPWHIDHCHVTGRIRGVLCALCNLGLGQFRDSPDLLEAAAVYLRDPPAPPPDHAWMARNLDAFFRGSRPRRKS